MHEYIDIRKIVQRMQDLDKLKIVLLNENQRKMFDIIPKPDILTNPHLNAKGSIENFVKFKRKAILKKEDEILLPKNFQQFMKEEDPINKRILEILDPSPRHAPTLALGFCLIILISSNIIS